MLVSNKHFVPVVGLDIHIVILFGFPVPLPHPYIGFVLDPMDYIPWIGASTKINHVPRGKSDTSGIIIILFHIPMGGPFALAPLIGHSSVNFYGSKKVKVENNLMTPAGHMLMTCNDIGLPLSMQPGKKLKPKPSMYLPTSFSIPLSFGKPVMVGGPYVPDWAGVILNLVMSYGFGALLKGLGSLVKGLNKKLGTGKLSKLLCWLGFDPMDLIQGIVIYDGCDFELPGPLPLRWERSWNSDSPYEGILGHGTHGSYDMRLEEVVDENVIGVLLRDGRTAVFDVLPHIGASNFNRQERMTLSSVAADEYLLFDHKERLYYQFKRLRPSDRGCRLFSIRNEAGFINNLHYDRKGHLTGMTDSVGRQLHVKNDEAGRVLEITVSHKGKEKLLVSYGYNEDGDLHEIGDGLGQFTHIRFQDHLMTAKTDRHGQTFYWEYDKQRRCVHTWGDGGLQEGWVEYHAAEGYNLVTNSQGHTTTYYYTPAFLVTQIKDPLGNSCFKEYTDDFDIYREIDEDGNVTGYTYDERGNRTSKTFPDGSSCTYQYNEYDRLVLLKNAEGGDQTYIYYKEGAHKGLLHTLTAADGGISVMRYNAHNLLSQVEDLRDRRTKLEYDEDYNLRALVLPNGARSSWEYNEWGNCVRFTNPLQQQQCFQFDELGRVTKIKLADGNDIHLQYNAYAEVIHARDKHHQVRYAYTPLGSLKMREENGVKNHFLYNNEEQLTTVVNAHGEQYKFVRNERGDTIAETGFDGITKAYQRDATGKVVKIKRSGNRWTTYEYDVRGNICRAEYSDGSWETYNYDKNGLLAEAINEHSYLQLKRDIMGRVIEEWQDGHLVNSHYGADGNRTHVSSSLGADIVFDRDIRGQVSHMLARGEKGSVWEAHIERDALGLEIERSLTGGIKSSWTFDEVGNISSHTVQHRESFIRNRKYRWDANQQLKQITNALAGGHISFGHDELGNLAWAQYEDGEYDYRLPDKAGNLYRTQGRKDRQYIAGGRLQKTASMQLEYDEEGNLIKKILAGTGTWAYEWYGNGMLKKVNRPDGGVVSYTYDAINRRTAKEYRGMVTRFVWDGPVPLHEWKYPVSDKPHVVIDELGDVVADHPEPVPASTLTTWLFEDGTFQPAAKIMDGGTYSIISDHLGTPCEAYDELGTKVWSCELDIYGKVRKYKGDQHFIPFRYQGQYEDEETGLYYNRCRYYSAAEGVYLSRDPIGLAGGNPTLYGYVKDPNVWVDVFGLDCKRVNLDAGTIRALVGENSPVRHTIKDMINGRQMVMTQSAANEAMEAMERLAGPVEKARFNRLMQKIQIIADDPSERAMNLATTKKVGDVDKVIFGTADKAGMQTITSDAKFLRGASAQGVDFDGLVHEPFSYLGI